MLNGTLIVHSVYYIFYCAILDPVSGGSVDWSYNYLCLKYSFGVEMRDTGNYGFMLPPKYIIPTAEEYFEGVKVLAKRIMAEGAVQRSAHCTSRYQRRQLQCYT